MSNAETSYLYNNFAFDVHRGAALADAVVASNIEIATQNTKATEALPRIPDADLRAIGQYELTEDQAIAVDHRQATGDQIPYEALHGYRNTMIGRLDHRIEEFIATRHQIDALRKQQEQRREDAILVEQLLGHTSGPTQRWLEMKEQETEERIVALESSFERGEITRLVDGVTKIDDLYHTAAQPWTIPTVRMPQAFPAEAFKEPEETTPAAKPIVYHDRRIIFSVPPTDVPSQTRRAASEVINPFEVPEYLKAETSTRAAEQAQPKKTTAERVVELLSSNNGAAVTSQDLAVYVYGAAEAELARPNNNGRIRASQLAGYLARPGAVRSVDDKLLAHGLSLQRGQRMVRQLVSDNKVLSKRQRLYRGVALDSEEAKGVTADDPGEISWSPIASYVPEEVTKTLEAIAAETVLNRGTIAQRIGYMLASNPETVFTTNDLAVILFGKEEAERRLGHRGSMRANQISGILKTTTSQDRITDILQQQVPPLEFQIGQNSARVLDAQGVTKRRPRAVYRSIIAGASPSSSDADTVWQTSNDTKE